MVRGGNGRLVAATIALLERQSNPDAAASLQTPPQVPSPPHNSSKDSDSDAREVLDSSMDDSTVKCASSTDSGKDDQSLITSNSSTTSNSNEDLDTICCKNDFQWVGKNGEPIPRPERPTKREEKRGRDMKRETANGEVRLRKATASLDRKKASRRERDAKCKSSSYHPPPPPPAYHSPTRHRDCCTHEYGGYCEYTDRIPPPHPHDYRIPYYYRPPIPCDFNYRYLHKVAIPVYEKLMKNLWVFSTPEIYGVYC